jgi:C4-type Zn-finger protein
MQLKECPMCGEMMHLVEKQATVNIPGKPELKSRTIQEWICNECGHFEEANPEDLRWREQK